MRWNSTAELANALEEHYPDEDLSSIRTSDVYDLILSLPDFEDDPDEVTTRLLETILEAWKECREENNG